MSHYFERCKERNQKLYRAFLKGKKLPQLSKEFGIGIQSTREALKKFGLKFPRGKNRKPTACERNAEIVFRMNSEKESLTAIGKAVGAKRSTVLKFLRKHGETREFPLSTRSEKHWNWKGGRVIDKNGYVLLRQPDHPNRSRHGYVREHRIVMEAMIGRLLLPNEVVHHRNGIKDDNRPENLQLFSENREHLKLDLAGRVPNWTPSGLERMKKGIARSAIVRRERILLKSKRDADQCK